MSSVTPASIAYVATQASIQAVFVVSARQANLFHQKARFALSSSSVFSRTDTITDSERFYSSILDLLEDPEEADEVDRLLTWWNQ